MKIRQSAAGAAMLVAMVALTGCGVTNDHDKVIKDVVSNRQFLYQTPGDGNATLQVVRANGFFGGGCSSQVLVDDKFAAQLETGEQATLYLPSGAHTVSLRNSGACHKVSGDAHVDTTLAAGESQIVQVNKWGSSLSLAKR
ncbi:hypothetical protein SAMN04487785_107164 [Dyella jiangningensis]|uniref:hypothetical protein n=1 Tax=Dyella sp. AtDHG13 TaxID=1938897 RepID=UPI00088ADC68|nr:hypothetical protein [Dyella sp. AtDHG13]PXV57349.1 hypothetical protein BDW41_107178 [Dyella sp. AtDHG13]SDK41102.1 hypothetical protein SAMN04487785_107164 [Dyella jiangningensis]